MNNLLVVYVCISDSTIWHLPLHLCVYMYLLMMEFATIS